MKACNASSQIVRSELTKVWDQCQVLVWSFIRQLKLKWSISFCFLFEVCVQETIEVKLNGISQLQFNSQLNVYDYRALKFNSKTLCVVFKLWNYIYLQVEVRSYWVVWNVGHFIEHNAMPASIGEKRFPICCWGQSCLISQLLSYVIYWYITIFCSFSCHQFILALRCGYQQNLIMMGTMLCSVMYFD